MRSIKLTVIALAAFFATINLSAQTLITKQARTEVINKLSKSLLDNYIFADKARSMKSLIQKNLDSGSYDNINNPDDFANRLTKDLRSVYNDLHLSVRFNPKQDYYG